MNYKALTLLIGLFGYQTIQAAHFTDDDIADLKVNLMPWKQNPELEQLVYNGTFVPPADGHRTLTLHSGIKVIVANTDLESFQTLINNTDSGFDLGDILLQEKFQKVQLSNGISIKVHQYYGEQCNDRFKDLYNELHATLFYNKSVPIESGRFELNRLDDMPPLPDNNGTIQDIACIYDVKYFDIMGKDIVFRCVGDHEKESFTVFRKKDVDVFHADYSHEEFLSAFCVYNIKKPFYTPKSETKPKFN